MSPYSPGSHRTILAVDMADFTNPARTSFHRTAMQEGLLDALRTAFDEAKVGWADCIVESRGDGFLILAPNGCSNGLLVDQMPKRLLAGLLRHNALHAVEAAIQLRVALHAGEVRAGEAGWDGDALNFTFRLLEAGPAKADLRQRKGVLAMIVSELFYREVVKSDPANEADAFQRIPVQVKRVDDHAWLRIQGSIPISIDDPHPLPVFADTGVERLRELLGDVSVSQQLELAAHATGQTAPPLPATSTAWEVAEYLLDFNAGPTGLPPVMVFVELLADHVDDALAAELRGWNDERADQPSLAAALRGFRDTKPLALDDKTALHLTILIDHDGADPEHYYVMSHWRQDDPYEWPPPLGETKIVPVALAEREVDSLALAAEIAWSGHRGQVGIEFVLPRSLLHIPVETWRKEHDSGAPLPLSLDYPVVIRSLERMRNQYWHRVWVNRWQVLADTSSGAHVHFASDAEIDEPYRMEVRLKDRSVVGIALSAAPRADLLPARDELTVALRSGLPIVFWTREDADTPPPLDALRLVVTHLAEANGLLDLPKRTLFARQAAFSGLLDEHIPAAAVRGLVLLWDDPGRLVIVDQPPTPWRPRGDAGDER